jgi:hypothetical protein
VKGEKKELGEPAAMGGAHQMREKVEAHGLPARGFR